jgi:hypothetical protein
VAAQVLAPSRHGALARPPNLDFHVFSKKMLDSIPTSRYVLLDRRNPP